MTLAGLFRVSGVAAIALAFSVALTAQAGDPLIAIQVQLSSGFKVSTLTADRTDIVNVGDVVQLHKPELVMYAVASPLPPANSYKNGKIGQGWGGFGKDIVIGMAAPGGATAADYPHRQFVAEEKCFVTSVQVQKDGVLFQLYSDPYDDVRYYANLKIPFLDKKSVPPADAEMKMIAEVLTVVPQNAGDAPKDASVPAPSAGAAPSPKPAPCAVQAAPPPGVSGKYFLKDTNSELNFLPDGSYTLNTSYGTPSHGQYQVSGDTLIATASNQKRPTVLKIQGDSLYTKTGMAYVRETSTPVPTCNPAPEAAPEAAPVAAEPQLPNIAPPPPPADTPPPTVAVGQTKDQVTAILGQPVKAAKIGAKEIYYYKDMKVTFMNGKVSNIE